MPQTLEEWTQQLADAPLPAMALTVNRVTELLDSPNATNSDFQRVIGEDPGFSLAIFREVNHSAAADKEPPHSLSHAIAILGHKPFGKILKGLPVLKKEVKGTPRDRLYRCYSRALHAAAYAHHWADERRDSNPDEMHLSALMYDCAEMSLWNQAPETMAKIEALEAKGLDRNSASRKILGFTLNQLSRALADNWRLPGLLGNALQAHWHSQNRPTEVLLAASIARSSDRAWNSQETRGLVELFADHKHISEDHAAAELHTLAAETARAIQDLPLWKSATALVTLPSSARAASRAPAQKKVKPKAASKPAAEKPQSIQDHFAHTMRRMQKEAGVERVMFAMLSSDRKRIKMRFLLGDKESPLRNFALPMGGRHLFSILLSKQQGIWLRDSNRDQYLPLIPEPVRDAIQSHGFFAMSVYLKNRPIGFLYGDCSEPGALNQDGYDRFKQLSLRLCNQLKQGK
jgi:HD-like signal output (HDOD) protein